MGLPRYSASTGERSAMKRDANISFSELSKTSKSNREGKQDKRKAFEKHVGGKKTRKRKGKIGDKGSGNELVSTQILTSDISRQLSSKFFLLKFATK